MYASSFPISSAVVEQKEVTFSYSQLEYFVEEITRALLDPSYSINLEGAPSEFQASKVDLSSFKVKDVEGVDIKTLNFQSTDSRAEGIISELKGELQEADSKFQNKKYESALKSYQDILGILEKSITQDARSSIKEYIDGIQKRIENTKTNLYGEKLKEIDQRFKLISSEASLPIIEKYISDYENLRASIQSNITNSNLIPSIDERTKKLESNLIGITEREGDSLYDNYQFSEALISYENSKNKINKTKRLSVNEKTSILNKIDKKIKVVQETGTSYYANQVKAYCNLAEKENVKVSLKKLKGENVSKSSIKENIRKAEMILRKNKLIDLDSLEYYNSIVKILNKDGDSIGVLMSKSEVGSSIVVQETSSMDSFEFDWNPPPLSPFLFPGLGHFEKNPNSFRGAMYRNLSIFSLGLIGLSYFNYSQKAEVYQGINVVPFFLISTQEGYIPALLYSDSILKTPRSQYESSIGLLNGSMGLFGLIYLVSLLDYSLTGDFKTSDGYKVRGMEYGKWDLKSERNLFPNNGSMSAEEKVKLEFRMYWF